MHYGGDQNWNEHWLMRLGGCSTVTACELSICIALQYPDMRNLYPYDPDDISKADFLAFFQEMFAFIRPGIHGLTDIEKYAGGLRKYADSRSCTVETRTLRGDMAIEDAAAFVHESIDAGLPLAYLMLNHRDPSFEDFEWHWFTVTGYENTESGLTLIAATYGVKHFLDLGKAWDTGHRWKGGLVAAAPPGVL